MYRVDDSVCRCLMGYNILYIVWFMDYESWAHMDYVIKSETIYA
jgi:hypothetical protein